jgi:adenosylhomocysteine nucleosidase
LNPRIVIIISADGEWQAIPKIFPDAEFEKSPYGEWTLRKFNDEPVILYHGFYGKIPSAASAQYVIDRWNPDVIFNFGTCGGFRGEIERDDIVLVEKAVVYDIISKIGSTEKAVNYFSSDIDLSWLKEPYPIPVHKGTIVSGDRDIQPDDIPLLKEKYGAKVGDWESGSISFVCRHNEVKLVILRGVSDLVDSEGGDAYGDRVIWVEAAEKIIRKLIDSLPGWIEIL